MLTVGDMMATFKNGRADRDPGRDQRQVELKVVAGADGALRLDVGTPTVYVDILDENVDGANQLSNAQFEAVVVVRAVAHRRVRQRRGRRGPAARVRRRRRAGRRGRPADGYLIVGGEIQ